MNSAVRMAGQAAGPGYDSIDDDFDGSGGAAHGGGGGSWQGGGRLAGSWQGGGGVNLTPASSYGQGARR